MIQRDSQDARIDVGQAVQLQRFNVDAGDARANPTVQVGDAGWASRLLGGIAESVGKVVSHAQEAEYEQRYLEGQAKAGRIASEDEIGGNPLTKDWEIAGYRDTMAKLRVASTEAQIALDIPKYADKSPKDFEAYLASTRAAITPELESLSREARAANFGKLLLTERAASAQHAKAHQKHIIDTQLIAVNTVRDTTLSVLSNAKHAVDMGNLSGTDYKNNVESAAGTLVAHIWEDPRFNIPGMREKLSAGMLGQALATDNLDLYEYLANVPMPDSSGGSSTILARLPDEDREKLQNQYRTTWDRNEQARNFHIAEQFNNIKMMLENGQYPESYDKLNQYLMAGVINKAFSNDEANKARDLFYKSKIESAKGASVITALTQGNTIALNNSGLSDNDIEKTVDKELANVNADAAARLRMWSNVARAGNTKLGYKKMGELIGPAMAQFGQDDDNGIEQHRSTYITLNNMIREADQLGKYNTVNDILNGVPEQYQMRYRRLVALTKDGQMSFEAARTQVLQTEASEASLTPSERAGMATQVREKAFKEIDSYGASGFLRNAGLGISQVWNPTDMVRREVMPENSIGSRDGWTGTPELVQHYENSARLAWKAYVNDVMIAHPYGDPSEIVGIAGARLAANSIKTSHGSVFLPPGTDTQKLWGIGAANKSGIGKAIDTLLGETKQNSRWKITFAQGTMRATEYVGDQVVTPSTVEITGQHIRDAMGVLASKEKDHASNVYGEGKLVKQSGVNLKYNGRNTAAAPEDWMYAFRENLIRNEGVKNVPYPDLSGKLDKHGNRIMTAGVGVSSHNKYYPKVGADGTVSDEAIAESFNGASNEAATAGMQVVRSTGLNNKEWFQLFAELGYQSGPSFLTQSNDTGQQYRDFVGAAKAGNLDAALLLFKGSAAWKYSADPKNPDKITGRQKHYERLIREAMKG